MTRARSRSQRRWLAALGSMAGVGLAVVASLAVVVLLQRSDRAASDGSTSPTSAEEQPDRQTAPLEVDLLADRDGGASPTTPTTTTTPTNPTNPTNPTISTTSTTSAAPAPQPPPLPAPYEPAFNEVQRDAKRLGGAVAYQLTNYGPGSSAADIAATVTADSSRTADLLAMIDVVHHPGTWSRGTIEYAQLGGHSGNGISIMVVVRQDLGSEGSPDVQRSETRTMDVRLTRSGGGNWQFHRLASAGGEPLVRPANLSALAASVVDNDRIRLPDSAKWDIYSGHTDPALLRFMADLAEVSPYSVVVLHTGHPHNVFGTDRLSNHTVGRAVDIYAVDALRIIDAHATTSPVYLLSEQLVERTDIREFGSPWLFPGATASNFTNEVHHDHLHIGVNP